MTILLNTHLSIRNSYWPSIIVCVLYQDLVYLWCMPDDATRDSTLVHIFSLQN